MLNLPVIARVTSTISVVGSFCAGSHQFYLGYVFEGADGFSPMLLMGWLLGDICNVIGTFWTHQLTFQRIIACASTVNDLALAGQHIYYKRKHKRSADNAGGEPVRVGRNRYLAMKWNSILRPYILFTLVRASAALPIMDSFPTGMSHQATKVIDLIGDDGDKIDWEFLVGQCMAWVAELSYAFALVPQVMENFSRKSTGSVSIIMFIADAVSSFNYLLTIFITADEKSSHYKMVEFLSEELPYIFGMALCFLLDVILLIQYSIYPQFVAQVSSVVSEIPSQRLIIPDDSSALQPFTSWKSRHSYVSTDENRQAY